MKMFKVSINSTPSYLVEANGPKAALAAVAAKCVTVEKVDAGEAVDLASKGMKVLKADKSGD